MPGALLGACVGFFGPPSHAELHSHIAGVLPAGIAAVPGRRARRHRGDAAITLGACLIINIKPGRVGGYLAARRIHDPVDEPVLPRRALVLGAGVHTPADIAALLTSLAAHAAAGLVVRSGQR